jgi:hypothetical protein
MSLVAPRSWGSSSNLRHATDVDHVAAVGAIVARERDVRGCAQARGC